LNLVAAKNLGIGHHDYLCLIAEESTGQAAQVYAQSGWRRRGLVVGRGGACQAILFPDFHEALALAIVVAKQVNLVVLSQPAMNLGKKILSLGVGDLRFRRTLGEGAESLKAPQIPRARFSLRPSFELIE
jgi:hypothetical protein